MTYYLVSWRNQNGLCENKSFKTEQEGIDFIKQNENKWRSYSLLKCTPNLDEPGVSAAVIIGTF